MYPWGGKSKGALIVADGLPSPPEFTIVEKRTMCLQPRWRNWQTR